MSLPILTPPSGQYPSGKVSTALPATPQQQPPTPNAKTAPLNDDTFVKQGSTPIAVSKPRSINTEPEEDTKPTIEATTTEPEKPPTHEPTTSKLPLILSSVAAVGSLATTGLLIFQQLKMKDIPKQLEDKIGTLVQNQVQKIIPEIQTSTTKALDEVGTKIKTETEKAIKQTSETTLQELLQNPAIAPLITKLNNSDINMANLTTAITETVNQSKEPIKANTKIVLEQLTKLSPEQTEQFMNQLSNTIDTAALNILLQQAKNSGVVPKELLETLERNPELINLGKQLQTVMEQSPELSETASKVAQQINEAIHNGGSAEDVIKAGLGGLSPQEAEKLQEEATKLFNGLLGTE